MREFTKYIKLSSLFLSCLLGARASAVPATWIGQEGYVLCEYRLGGDLTIRHAAALLETGLSRQSTEGVGQVASANLSAKALAAFGLQDLNALQLRQVDIQFAQLSGRYELIPSVKDLASGNRVKLPNIALTMRAYYGWQSLPYSQRQLDMVIRDEAGNSLSRLAPPSVSELAVGTIFSEDGQAVRRYLSLERYKGLYRYQLGLDVACERMGEFSRTPDFIFLRSERGWLCRVPVLQIWRSRDRSDPDFPPGGDIGQVKI